MKTVGILLIGLGTAFVLYLSKTNPEQSLDSSLLLLVAGAWFLTSGLVTDKLTSQHSNNTD
jgi:UPF0716 family protein affecting phage T7 exclusion